MRLSHKCSALLVSKKLVTEEAWEAIRGKGHSGDYSFPISLTRAEPIISTAPIMPNNDSFS